MHSFPSKAKLKNTWTYTFTLPYDIKAWQLSTATNIQSSPPPFVAPPSLRVRDGLQREILYYEYFKFVNCQHTATDFSRQPAKNLVITDVEYTLSMTVKQQFNIFHPMLHVSCFFLSCKANAWVKPAKTGHGPHSSNFCVVLRIVCFVSFYVLFVCKMCTATGC